MDGNFVPESGVSAGVGRGARGGRIFGLQVDSHEKTINKGKHEISQVADRLGIRPREDITSAAHRLYKLAVQRNFTRGRRTQQVAGACLYIVCRQESRPYMLIDFSDVVQTNVYVLGAVFLQLCRLLRLEQHPLVSKPIDPSLFIHRFADKLNLGRKMHAVANTALRLVASMKRDWMQTGRRPSGVCGAALWVAALLHQFERSKRDVVAVVHVGEATLRKRVAEFENTPSALLSVEEFDSKAKEYEKEQAQLANGGGIVLSAGSTTTLTCAHKDHEGATHFAHGMCRMCYVEYARVCGGARGGEDPPAFQAAENKRKKEEQRQLMLPAGTTVPALPAPESAAATLALPAPAANAAAAAARGKGRPPRRATASEMHSAIAAAAAKASGGKDASSAGGAAGSSIMGSTTAMHSYLEAEMDKALGDRSSHLGEFAALAGVGGRGGPKPKPKREPAEPGAEPGASPAAAFAVLKHLVGEKRASEAFDAVTGERKGARAAITQRHLAGAHPDAKRDPAGTTRGGRLRGADAAGLRRLVAAGCFDATATARIKKIRPEVVPDEKAAAVPGGGAAGNAAAGNRSVSAASAAAALRAPAAGGPPSSSAAAAAAAARAEKLAIAAAAAESNANHEKTRRDLARAAAREARALTGSKIKKEEEEGEGAAAAAAAAAGKEGGGAGASDGGGGSTSDDGSGSSDSDSESDSEADPETFSDVDDDEVADYIHTDEEVKLRRVIWSELNKDYLETQAAKEAAVAAAPPGGAGAASAGDKGDETDEKDANGKGKKKRKRYTHVVPADTAAEAAHAMLSSKKISSKINYDALNNLFKDDAHHAHATRRGEEQTAKAPHPRGRQAAAAATAAAAARRGSVGRGEGRLGSRVAAGDGFGAAFEERDEGARERTAASDAAAASGAPGPQKSVAVRAAEAAAKVPAPRRGMSEAMLAEAAMQSTGGRSRKARGAKGADWLS